MKRSNLPLCAAIILAAPSVATAQQAQAPQINLDQLAGAWKVVSYVTHHITTNNDTQPFGDTPQGYLLFVKEANNNFRTTFIVTSSDRPTPAGAVPTEQEAVKLFATLTAFSGDTVMTPNPDGTLTGKA